MKKVAKTLKQSLSILLAVAMVITCVPQTATLSLAALDTDIIDTETSTEAEAPAELEVSTDDFGLVLNDETVIPADTTEQPDMEDNDATGDDTEVELMEGGLEIQEAPTVNPDKATDDSHAISFEVDAEQVEVTENGTAFVETEEANGSYTFKAVAKTGHKITSISAYKDSDKSTSEGADPWDEATAVATWTPEGDANTIIYDTEKKEYSITEKVLITDSSATAAESFTIVIKSEKESYDVTVTLFDTETSNITSWTYGIDDEDATKTAGAFGTPIKVPYNSTLKIKLVPAANRAVTVERDGEAVSADASGIYTFENITGVTAITVSTQDATPDEYAITFDTKDAIGAEVKIVKDGTPADPAADGEKVNLGDTITFTVKPGSQTVDDEEVANKLRYVNTKPNKEGAMTAKSVEDGVYTYEYTVGDDTAANTTIYVSATPAQDITLALDFRGADAEEVTINKVTVAGTTENPSYELGETVTGSITAKEDSSVYLVIEPTATSKYKVTGVDVSYGEKSPAVPEITIGTGESAKTCSAYVINFTEEANNEKIIIELELDDTKANVAKFALKDSAASVNAFTVEFDGEEYHAGEHFLTAESSIAFYIWGNAGYEINEVVAAWTGKDDQAKTEPLTADEEDGFYTLTFDAENNKRDVTITVDASVSAMKNDATVSFNKISSGIHSYEVEETETVSNRTGNIYDLKEGAQLVEFTVFALENYTPAVSYEGYDEDGFKTDIPVTTPAKGEAATKGTGKAKVTVYPYVYSVPAVVLGNKGVIRIDAKPTTKNIEIIFNQYETDVLVKQNGEFLREFEDIKDEQNNVIGEKFAVPVNSDATLVIEPYSNCEITKAVYQIGDGTPKNVTAKELKAGEFKLSGISDNATVTITSNANYAVVVRNVNTEGQAVGSPLEAVKGAYTVDYTGQYKITAVKGAYKTEPIAAVEVMQTNAVEADKVQMATLAEDKSVDLKLFAADAGKTVKLKLTFGEGESTEEKIVEFKVLSKITKLTIKGITLDNAGKGTLSQDADTQKEYPITLTPNTANMAKLDVKVLPADPADKENPTETEITAAQALLGAGIVDGKLTVTTKPQKDKADAEVLDKAVIRVVDTNLQESDEAYVKAEVIVSITAPKALKDATPVVSVKSATDTTLTLSLGLDKKVKVENPLAGELWYQVTVAADAEYGEAKLADNIDISNAVGTFYIKKDAASTTQDATLKVSNANVGSGKAWGYKLQAKLVQLEDKTNLSTVDTDLAKRLMLSTVNIKALDSKITNATEKTAFASKTTGEVAAETRTPYYETKLKLKKGKTTVYTGQQMVPIATLQFNNETTYRMAKAEDISQYWYDGVDLVAGDNNDFEGMVHLTVKDGTVYMSVDECYFNGYDDDYGYDDIYNAPITGSHTIRVTATAPDQTYPVSADIKVTVVRGINALDVVPASTVVYKAEGKAATLKVTPVYNNDYTGKDKTAQPKTKKLSYELVDDSYKPYTHPYIKINPKNGTVTIDKKYDPSREYEDESFVIKATAMDFDGNRTEGYSDPITISGKALEIDRVEILQEVTEYVYDEDGYVDGYNTTYNVVAKDGDQVTSDELTAGNVRVVAFKPSTPEKLSYTARELFGYDEWGDVVGSGYALDSSMVSFKCSNKAVQLTSYGYITGVSKVANNVTITATANDGGKKKAAMKFNVVNAEPEYLGLYVEKQDDSLNGYSEIFKNGAEADQSAQHNVNVNGTANTVLRLSMVQKAEVGDEWVKAYQYANVKMTVSGGKVLQKADAFNRGMLIVANKETITVTLENKSLKPSVKQTFTITNKAAGALTAFQKVTTATKALTTYSYNRREIKYQLNARDKDKYEFTETKDQLYVMIQPDAADRSKKSSQYRELEARSGINGTQPVEKDGSFKIWFDRGYLTPGTYKLQLTFGKISNDRTEETYGSFVAESKPQTVSVKINASKTKVSFKPATTLTMSLKDKASVTLTGSGKNYDIVDFSNLQNINGYGTSNKEERFTEYFELNGGWDGSEWRDCTISLRDDLTESQIAFITGSSKKAQNARTAYIDYMAWNSNFEITTHEVWGTAKITVKFVADDKDGNLKPAASYSMASSVIIEGNKNTAVSVTSAKKPANVLYAAVSDPSDGKFDIAAGEMWVDSDTFTLSSQNDTLAVNKNGYTVKVKVIPEGAHASLLKDIEEAWQAYRDAEQGDAKNQAAETYKNAILNSKAAIELTTKVKVVAKSESVKKIVIAASELKKDTWRYYEVDKNYWSHVYYTKATCDSDVFDVTASFKTNDLTDTYKDVISFGESSDDDAGLFFDIVVNKEALAAAEAAQQAKGANKHAYGTTIDVKASVSYGKLEKQDDDWNWVKDESVKADEFTFKVTLPKKPETGNFAETLAKVKAETAKDAFYETLYAGQDYPEFSRECKGYPFGGWDYEEGSWTLSGPADPDTWDDWYENQVIWGNQKQADLYGYINSALWQVHDAIYAMAPEDSETEIVMVQHADGWERITLNPGEFVAPTSVADGKLVIRVQLTDNTIYTEDEEGWITIKNECRDGEDEDGNPIIKPEYRETLSITLKIPKTGEEPNDIKDILKQYVADAKSNKTYAKMPGVEYEDIFADIIKEDGGLAKALDKYPTLRFNIEGPYEINIFDEDMWDYTQAYYAQPQEWVDNWAWYDDEYYWDGTYDGLPGEYKFTYSYTDDMDEVFSSYLTPSMGWRREASEAADGYIAGILHVWGIKYGGDEVRVPFIFTIDKLDGIAAIESNIKVALGDKTAIAGLSEAEKKEKVKLAPNNRTTKEEIEAIFKAAYANPMVEASWGELTGIAQDAEEKGFVVKEATAPSGDNDGKGSIRCAIKLSQDGAEDKTFEVEIEIPALKAANEAVNAVKAAVIDKDDDGVLQVMYIITPIVEEHLKTITTAEELPDELKETIVSEVKAAILKAANDTLAGQPYTVVYKQEENGDNKNDVFAFEPYTYKSNGKISYTLEVKALTKGLNGDSDAVVGAVVDGGELTLKTTDNESNEITEVPLSKDPSLVTFLQAAAVIEEALKAMSNVSNSTSSVEVCEAAERAIEELAVDEFNDTGIIVSHKEIEDEDGVTVEDYTFTPATFTEKGSLTGTLVLSRIVYDESAGEDEDDPNAGIHAITHEYAYSLELPMLAKNDEIVVKAEVQRALQAVGVTNKDAGEETTEGSNIFKLVTEKETALIEEAIRVVADSGYEIEHDTDEAKVSTVTKKATVNEKGSAKVSFILKAAEGNSDATVSDDGKFDVTITIPILYQSATQLEQAIKEVLGKMYPNDEVTLPAGTTAEDYCQTLADAILTAVTATDVMKNTLAVRWADDSGLQVVYDSESQASGYEGTLNIYKSTNANAKPSRTVNVALTIVSSETP